jgi:hypothetical protein
MSNFPSQNDNTTRRFAKTVLVWATLSSIGATIITLAL